MPPTKQRNIVNRQSFLMPLLFLSLFIAAWAPRVMDLDSFVTVDERKWLNRSANFYYALRHGDLAATASQGHPGVTVMWVGAAGFLQRFPEYSQRAPRLLTDQEMEEWLDAHASVTPLDLLVAGRWWITLMIALTIAGAYFPLSNLFGRRTAAYTTLFLAWNPFYLAFSRQLHPDSLLTGLTTLTMISFLAWLYGTRRHRYLIIAGVTMGLALLTKSPAFLLIPSILLLLALESMRQFKVVAWAPRHLVQGALIGSALALFTFVVLWPAVWRNPIDVLLRLLDFAYAHAAAGHDLPNYFFGQTTNNPGPLFYPVAYFFRASPATLLGLIAAFVWAWRRQFPLDTPIVRRTTLAVGLFALLFSLGMTLGMKKFDRYILPIFLMLDIVAVVGWVGSAHRIGSYWRQRRARLHTTHAPPPYVQPMQFHATMLAGLVVLHGLPGLVHFPYYLTYYNPLAGGSRTAPHVLLIGRGEGLNEAAEWLNQQPNAEHLRVVSWYGDGPLAYYLNSKETVLPFYGTDHYWFDADYAVLYVNQWQRKNPAAAITDYFLSRTPAYTVKAGNLELAHVYDMRRTAPPDFSHIFLKENVEFGGKIQVPAYRFEEPSTFPGESVEITIFLKSMAPIDTNYDAILSLVSSDGAAIWHEQRPPAGMSTTNWPLHTIRNDTYQIPIPADVEPGSYTIRLAFPELADSAALAGLAKSDGVAERLDSYEITELQVQSPERWTPDAQWDSVRVTSLSHPSTVAPGQTLLVDLSTAGQVDGSLKLSLRIVHPSGNAIVQIDKILKSNLRFDLKVPEDVDPGSYSLVAVVYNPDTLVALPDIHGQNATALSQIQVQMDGE